MSRMPLRSATPNLSGVNEKKPAVGRTAVGPRHFSSEQSNAQPALRTRPPSSKPPLPSTGRGGGVGGPTGVTSTSNGRPNKMHVVETSGSRPQTPEAEDGEILEMEESAALATQVESLQRALTEKRSATFRLTQQLYDMQQLFVDRKAKENARQDIAREERNAKILECTEQLQKQTEATAKTTASLNNARGRLVEAEVVKANLDDDLQRRRQDHEAVNRETASVQLKTAQAMEKSAQIRAQIKVVDLKKAEQEANRQQLAEDLEKRERRLSERQNVYKQKVSVVSELQKKIDHLTRHRKH